MCLARGIDPDLRVSEAPPGYVTLPGYPRAMIAPDPISIYPAWSFFARDARAVLQRDENP